MLPPSNLDWLIVLEAGAGVGWAGPALSPKSCLGPHWSGPLALAVSCLLLSALLFRKDLHTLLHPPLMALSCAHCSLFIYSQFPIMRHVPGMGQALARCWGRDNKRAVASQLTQWSETLEGIQGVARPGELRGQQAAPSPSGSSTRRREKGYPLSVRGPSLV